MYSEYSFPFPVGRIDCWLTKKKCKTSGEHKKTLFVRLRTSTKILPSPFPTSDACIKMRLGENSPTLAAALLLSHFFWAYFHCCSCYPEQGSRKKKAANRKRVTPDRFKRPWRGEIRGGPPKRLYINSPVPVLLMDSTASSVQFGSGGRYTEPAVLIRRAGG